MEEKCVLQEAPNFLTTKYVAVSKELLSGLESRLCLPGRMTSEFVFSQFDSLENYTGQMWTIVAATSAVRDCVWPRGPVSWHAGPRPM